MQEPLHSRFGARHGVTQEPLSQLSPAAQLRPQKPQLARSLAMSTQLDPQSVSNPRQMQVPPMQL